MEIPDFWVRCGCGSLWTVAREGSVIMWQCRYCHAVFPVEPLLRKYKTMNETG